MVRFQGKIRVLLGINFSFIQMQESQADEVIVPFPSSTEQNTTFDCPESPPPATQIEKLLLLTLELLQEICCPLSQVV
jgi:hypothetical protein